MTLAAQNVTKSYRPRKVQRVYFSTTLLDVKGTNGRQKTYEISHVYSIFYSDFICQTTVIFGITKDWSLY